MKNQGDLLNRQKGVVLVVSLVMLLLLTLIGVTGAQVTGLEEKMAGNSRDQAIAFQAAEATLLAAERFVLSNSTDDAVTYTGASGLLGLNDNEPDFFDSTSWATASSQSTNNGFGANFGLPANPRYIIKKIYQNGSENTFQITARAVGRSPGTQIVLQIIYKRTV